MTNKDGASARFTDFKMKPFSARSLPAARCTRPYCRTLCALAYTWIGVSTHAAVSSLNFQPRLDGPATTSPISGMEMFYPLVGLVAAVAFTHILRRRRMARVEASAVLDR